MRTGALGLLAVIGACNIAEHDPITLLHGRAPPDAVDCGHAAGDPELLTATRACVVAALTEGRPFIAASNPDSADGYQAIGWGSAWDGDGPPFLRLDYEMAIGMMPGTDHEEWSWTGCGAIGQRGDDCPSLAADLCLACSSPVSID